MKIRLLALLIMGLTFMSIQGQATNIKILGAASTQLRFIGSVAVDTAFRLPLRPITDTSDTNKKKKLASEGVLFYGKRTTDDEGQLYYHNSKRFIPVLSGQDSSIYATDGNINQERTVNVQRRLSFTGNGLVSINNLRTLSRLQVPTNIWPIGSTENPAIRGRIFMATERVAPVGIGFLKIITPGQTPSYTLYYSDGKYYIPLLYGQDSSIYSTDGTIKNNRTINLPASTGIRFKGLSQPPASLRNLKIPTGSVPGSNLDFEIAADAGNSKPNATFINQYGNLSIIDTDENFNNDIRLAIPLFISRNTKGPVAHVYANRTSPDNSAIHTLNHLGVAKVSSKTSGADRYSQLKALIAGNVLIQEGTLIISSDQRIKKVKSKAAQSESIRRLKNLNVYHYQFKDSIAKGNKMMTGVLAQEVQKIMPDALLSLPGSVIPDIYKNADSIRNISNNSRIYLPAPFNSDSLKVGTKLKFYLKKNKTEHRKIIRITKDYIEVPYLCGEHEPVFVYGRFINDLLNVDYNQIFMENVNVTKYLLQQQDIYKNKTEGLENKVLILEQALEKKKRCRTNTGT